MSSANLDLVRSINAAHERGDFSSAAWADPEIEYVIADGPSPGRWTGPQGMAETFRGNLVGWEHFRIEADEYRELDDERILVLTRSSAYGKAAGRLVGQMRAKGAVLYHVSDGKVTRLVYYWDREHALADTGLASEDATTGR
jgi:ketosteroid isomerase-like protein